MSLFLEYLRYIVLGFVVPEAPFDAWSKGHMIDVPLLIGLHIYLTLKPEKIKNENKNQ